MAHSLVVFSDTKQNKGKLQVNLLKVGAVNRVESIEIGAVDIKDSNDFAVTADRDHNLAIGGRRTGNMAGKLVDVGDNQCTVLLPSGAANTFSVRDTGASYGALKRTKNELVSLHAVEPRPPETESFVENSNDIGHIGNKIGLASNERLNLRDKGPVNFLFAHIGTDL